MRLTLTALLLVVGCGGPEPQIPDAAPPAPDARYVGVCPAARCLCAPDGCCSCRLERDELVWCGADPLVCPPP